MYREITVESDFKNFHIVPTVDNKYKPIPKQLRVDFNGLEDKITPFYAIFHFKDKKEYGDFLDNLNNKLPLKPVLLATKIKESNVFKPPKQNKEIKQYAKWEFFDVEKLY